MISHKKYDKVDLYAHQSAKTGKDACGDSYYIKETKDYFLCALADGLGSGMEARVSSQAAISAIRDHADEDVQSLMNRANKSLYNKRGAVLGLLKVYYEKRELEYACVGNIRFVMYSPGGKITHPLPKSGYLSGKPASFRVQRFPYEPDSSFLMHSDGLEIRSIKNIVWELRSIKAASQKIRQLIDKPKDDVTFLIGKIG
ncbi:PP2C family serine/threonine-protein phosphatase [Bacillus marinisedimentorum]|uniref:PP2C family serine/threonine-protein phosphatase n=1 Tax=Bacillus marinisedimentorum TaxID=1821260 RepID=UPI00087272C8|nr:PP2C family serine/threonine-protein phosphatase [Bacillus marinisedimentorum]